MQLSERYLSNDKYRIIASYRAIGNDGSIDPNLKSMVVEMLIWIVGDAPKKYFEERIFATRYLRKLADVKSIYYPSRIFSERGIEFVPDKPFSRNPLGLLGRDRLVRKLVSTIIEVIALVMEYHVPRGNCYRGGTGGHSRLVALRGCGKFG